MVLYGLSSSFSSMLIAYPLTRNVKLLNSEVQPQIIKWNFHTSHLLLEVIYRSLKSLKAFLTYYVHMLHIDYLHMKHCFKYI